ncbi:MAG: hypothetical protein Q8R15_05090 [Candidatus Micrarchaeota archaeon]|nr:hypothetical protein [Candidatus Micrarchaeota archaeon]
MSEVIHAMTRNGMLTAQHAKLLAAHLTTPEGATRKIGAGTYNYPTRFALRKRSEGLHENPQLRAAIDKANELGMIDIKRGGSARGSHGVTNEVTLNSHWAGELSAYLKSFKAGVDRRRRFAAAKSLNP